MAKTSNIFLRWWWWLWCPLCTRPARLSWILIVLSSYLSETIQSAAGR